LDDARDELGRLRKLNSGHFDWNAQAQKKKSAALTFSLFAGRCLEKQKAGAIISTRSRKAPKSSTLNREAASIAALKRFFGDTPLDKITLEKIQAYTPWRTAQKLVRSGKETESFVSPSCVANELAALRKILRHARAIGAVSTVPEFSLPAKGKREKVLSSADLNRLLEASPLWLSRIVSVAVETSLSEADLLRLSENMIDEMNGVIVPEGGRAKTGVQQFAPITPKVKTILADIGREKRSVMNISKLIFTRDGKPISKGMLQGAFCTAVKRAKLEDVHFHDLRHTAKSRWAREGIPVDIAMTASGHNSVQAHKLYIHLQRSDVAKAFKMFPTCSRENEGENQESVNS
jgi:integrase